MAVFMGANTVELSAALINELLGADIASPMTISGSCWDAEPICELSYVTLMPLSRLILVIPILVMGLDMDGCCGFFIIDTFSGVYVVIVFFNGAICMSFTGVDDTLCSQSSLGGVRGYTSI